MKKVIVAFGMGVTPSGIGLIGENIVRTVKDLSAIQKTDVVIFSGSHKKLSNSEAFLMEKFAKEHLAVKTPILREESGKSLWKRALAIVRMLTEKYPKEHFLILFVVHPLQMRRTMAAFEAVELIERDASFIASPYPAREEYDELLSKKKYRSARALERHEKRFYFLYRLFSFPYPRFSFFRVLSSLRIRV